MMFKNRAINKEYLAIVEGIAGNAGETKTLENYHEKDGKTRIAKIMEPKTATSTQIITKYTVTASNKTHSLLRVEPITGRFHQIRAHLSFAGFPLAGDIKYGGKPIDAKYGKNLLLHCHRLSAAYKGGMAWTAPVPENFIKYINTCFGVSV